MPYAKLRSDLLTTRDQRQARLQELFTEDSGSLLQLSLNVPGPVKLPAGAESLFRWGRSQLQAAFPQLTELHLATDCLGPWAVYRTPLAATDAKYRCCAIEETRAFARLLDIDVFRADGSVCDRQLLGIDQRNCLLCSSPAKECIRDRRHTPHELKSRYEELLSICGA